MTTKQFPKYWVVNIQENADHELLPKFKEWYNKITTKEWYFTSTYYGYSGHCLYNGYCDKDNLSSFNNNPIIITLEEWHDHFFSSEKPKKPKATYTQYFKRSDGVVFTENTINEETLESIKESRKADLASANRKQLLINEHKKLFGNI